MTETTHPSVPAAPAVIDGGPRPEPVWLALEPDPVLAFLHLPAESERRRSTAALIVPPFGWDEMCSHRGRRRWAQALSMAGYPAARIDLPGAGNSGGLPGDPARLDAWISAVAGAAAWLREASGCERVVAIGIGLGGLLAYEAAVADAAIDDLVLWAVPASGRLLLRELRAYAGVISARNAADRRDGTSGDGEELIGFLLSAETAKALGAVKLNERELPRARERRVLLIGRDALGVDKRLLAHLQAAGADVTVADAGDYGALMAHPQEAQTPVASIKRTIAWMHEGSRPAPASTRRVPAAQRSEISLGGTVRERPLEFELTEVATVGVLSEPVEAERAPVCVVLLNAGALRGTGPNRIWVEAARRWAARGVTSVRLDLAGIGDAEGDERLLVTNASLYSERAIQDTLEVLTQLTARGLGERFVLAGLCSGAYLSLHAAMRGAPIAAALMINLYAFWWSEELVAERHATDSLNRLRADGWRRLIRRDVSVAQLMSAMGSLRPDRVRTGARRAIEREQRPLIEGALDQLLAQGTDLLLLLSHGEPLYDQLERDGFLREAGRWPNLTLERIPTRDHMFRALWLQHYVHGALDRSLEQVLARST